MARRRSRCATWTSFLAVWQQARLFRSLDSCFYRHVPGGPRLAEQNDIFRLVLVVQGILDFHVDGAGQEPGLAAAANARTTFEVYVYTSIFRYLQQCFLRCQGRGFHRPRKGQDGAGLIATR